MNGKAIRDNTLYFLLFAALGAVLYSRTLHVPWVFDDINNIVENPLIQDLRLAFERVTGARGVAYLSFALNYRFGGYGLPGFHIVNIAIHIITSFIVFLLMRRVFRESLWLPLAGGLIFLAHPVQTQAVNYIVQRMASMCGLFFFLSLYFYIRARETLNGGRRYCSAPHLGFYLLSLGFCLLGLWTKQNAVVLPLALLMTDRYFLGDKLPIRRRLVYLLPFFLITAAYTYQQVGGDKVMLKEAGRAQYWAKANETSANLKAAAGAAPAAPVQVKLSKPPENLQALYLGTEFSVLWLYIRLLFLPYNQVFDYGYPLTAAFFTLQNMVALSGHVLLVALAVWLRTRRPLVSFGILWFYLTLGVESSIIPLDAAVEHRLYMTMFGFSVVLLDLLRLIPGRDAVRYLSAGAVVVLMIATWQRNTLWADPIAFAEDNVRKAPFNQRNYLTLATAYADKGRWPEAEKTLRAAIGLRPDYPVPYENLGSALARQGRFLEALNFYQMALNLSPDNSNTLYNAGLVLTRIGDLAGAKVLADRLKPLNSQLAGRLESFMVRGSDGG